MHNHDLFEDAHRRVCIAKQRNETDRSRMWTGLAVPSTMKPLIKRGLMKPVHPPERPRAANWYTFTDAGWEEYDRRYKDEPDYFDK